MSDWASGFADANAIRIHYLRVGGKKPPLVFLHGLLGSGACLGPIARALASDFDIVLPDARGHGDSSAPADGYRYDVLARDALGLIRALDLARPVLVGHSMGGMTAAVAASLAPESLRGLVLVDPTFLEPARQREVWESDVAGEHRRMAELGKEGLVTQARARQPHRAVELLEHLADARLRTCLDAFEILRPPNPPYREVVAGLALPTLLVVGDATVVTRAMADELAGLQPRLKIAAIEGAGHGVPYDAPERVAELVGSFARALA